MGILNVTPDSFAELTARLDPARAADDALAMEAAGADIIDIGGESTRPGAEPIDAEEELRRVLPVVRALGSQASVPISIDTYKASVATAALGEGASIVNDISALRYDPGLGGVVARHGAALILMHNRGRSRDMYREARYGSVTREIVEELRGAIEAAENGGVARARLLVDPGLGFAKQAPHSFEALARLDSLAGLDRPIVVGPSRKSFLTRAIGEVPPQARDWGTAGAVAAAVLAGAHVVRVHAVAEMVQVVRVADEIRTAALAHRVD
ncbi:MAG: dihydropteroate synthase [Acidobacteria bacterium]|nr:dihydropteroate synthase [Acidobacteriota bacterium]